MTLQSFPIHSGKTKKILISGASSGIGLASAEALAACGHTVYAGVRNLTKVKFQNSKITPLKMDVTIPEDISRVIDEISHSSGLDVIINNAGIVCGGPLESVGLEGVKDQFNVNVFGLYELTRQSLPLLMKSPDPLIINVSSVSGLFGSPFLGAYASSKFAVEGMSDSWRRELRKFNIPVVLLEPGPVKTPIWDKPSNINRDEGRCSVEEKYQPELDEFLEYVEREAESAIPVSELANLMIEIVESDNPKARYVINGRSFLFKLFSFLPEGFVDSLVAKGIAKRR